jgi:hypothetical protein
MLKLRPRSAATILTGGAKPPLDTDVIRWLKGEVAQGKASIVKLGVDFYLLNYLLAVVARRSSTVLPALDPRVDAWRLEITSVRAAAINWLDKFFFTYLCAATAGELRHSRDGATVEQHHMQRLERWKVASPSKDRWQVQKEFLCELQDDNVLEYLNDAIDVFGVHWHRGGYGGPAWKIIAETGRDRLLGRVDPVSFIDRVFDLRHNGGPMFDKNPAIEQSNINDFLGAKMALSDDGDWNRWLLYGSPRLKQLLKIGSLLGLWRGATPKPTDEPPEEDEETPHVSIPKHVPTKLKWPASLVCEGGPK